MISSSDSLSSEVSESESESEAELLADEVSSACSSTTSSSKSAFPLPLSTAVTVVMANTAGVVYTGRKFLDAKRDARGPMRGHVELMARRGPRAVNTLMQSLTPVARTLARSTSRARPSFLSPLLVRYNHAQPSQSAEAASAGRTTHFGFQTVREEDKEDMVKHVFSSVAGKYDLMNDAMSMGVHRLWKDEYVGGLNPGAKRPMRCIDVAGGTGDIAMRILDHAREHHADRETSVDVVDINPEMLKEGFKRFKKTMYHNSLSSASTRAVLN